MTTDDLRDGLALVESVTGELEACCPLQPATDDEEARERIRRRCSAMSSLRQNEGLVRRLERRFLLREARRYFQLPVDLPNDALDRELDGLSMLAERVERIESAQDWAKVLALLSSVRKSIHRHLEAAEQRKARTNEPRIAAELERPDDCERRAGSGTKRTSGEWYGQLLAYITNLSLDRRLPSIRQLAAMVGVSHSTLSRNKQFRGVYDCLAAGARREPKTGFVKDDGEVDGLVDAPPGE